MSRNNNAEFIKKYPEYGEGGRRSGSDSFYVGDMRELALEIKKILASLKSGRVR